MEKTQFLVYSIQLPETDDYVVLMLQKCFRILESQTELTMYMGVEAVSSCTLEWWLNFTTLTRAINHSAHESAAVKHSKALSARSDTVDYSSGN